MSDSAAGLRILIVEDEPLIAMLLEEELSELGCAVVGVCETVACAMEKMAALPDGIDGAILDVSLAGENVFPVATALRARGVPVMFSTGYDADVLPAIFTGAPMIKKPFNMNALEAAVIQAFCPG